MICITHNYKILLLLQLKQTTVSIHPSWQIFMNLLNRNTLRTMIDGTFSFYCRNINFFPPSSAVTAFLWCNPYVFNTVKRMYFSKFYLFSRCWETNGNLGITSIWNFSDQCNEKYIAIAHFKSCSQRKTKGLFFLNVKIKNRILKMWRF